MTSETSNLRKLNGNGLPRYLDDSHNFSYLKKLSPCSKRRRPFAMAARRGGYFTRYLIYFLLLCLMMVMMSYLPLWRGMQELSEHANSSMSGDAGAGAALQKGDHIVLYRIIGNDLPPRHKAGQTLRNVRFILENEPDFPRTVKWWILNRIVDPASEQALIRLLKQYRQPYFRIPFSEEEYLQKDFRLEDFPEPDFFHSTEYMRFSKAAKLRTIDYTYTDKNLYAMNNNGGRNEALNHAKHKLKGVKWIFPFDGNCYLTKGAFDDILKQLNKYGKTHPYFIVPMARLINNTQLLTGPDVQPKTPEEPQIIFRVDSTEEYNLQMRYGRRSKLELLWRLGALENRRALNKPQVPWEPVEREYSPTDKGKFKSAGWVFRLFSGQANQEESKKEASSIRAFNRLLAIQDFLDGVDERIARKQFRQENLFLYSEEGLKQSRFRYWGGDSKIEAIVEQLQEEADELVAKVQREFREERVVARVTGSGLARTLSHPFGPNDNEKDSAAMGAEEEPMLNEPDTGHDERDSSEGTRGSSFPKPVFASSTTASSDPSGQTTRPLRISLSSLSESVTTLALAHFFTSNETYARWAGNLVRVHLLAEYALETADEVHPPALHADHSDFLNDQGYSFPSLHRLPRVIPKHGTLPLAIPPDLTTADLAPLLDAIRMLRKAHALTHKEYVDLQSIASDLLEYLVNSPTGIHLAQMPDHRGTGYDLQVAALATFTDDVRLYLRVINRCRMRVGRQFDQDGQQRQHFADAKVASLALTERQRLLVRLHYDTLNFAHWTLLAHAVQNAGVGRDLWHYTARDRGKVSLAVAVHLNRYIGAQDDYEDGEWIRSRLLPLARLAYSTHQRSPVINTQIHKNIIRVLDRVKSRWSYLWESPELASGRAGDLADVIGISSGGGSSSGGARSGFPPYWVLGVL
ncbi:uncharacterized protein VTP21DRAFT_5473 [Calcarisporiella thermophila]|uniref:uncharacterized protein n=1 Tax=Calcarisporiella thermophila TaxID=911321 RepID=UPI0037434793